MVEKAKSIETIVPAFQRLKFDFWRHDSVVLHGHDIRKAAGDFNILLNPKTRATFIDRVSRTPRQIQLANGFYRYLGMAI